jgi:hypothetical protein
MKSPVTWVSDRIRDFFNPGEAELNVPPLEGPLKPNDEISGASVVAEMAGVDNVVADGDSLLLTAECDLWRVSGSTTAKERSFDHPVSSLLPLSGGGFAVGLDGHGIVVVGGPHDGTTIRELDGRPVVAVTDLAEIEGALWIVEGSLEHRASDWLKDLMGKHRSGRVSRFDLATKKGAVIASGLGWPSGIATVAPDGAGDEVLVSVAWEHRLVRLSTTTRSGGKRAITPWKNLPGYPGRIRTAHGRDTGGGYWLAMFAMRTKLVEFVLQEDEYRRAMMAQIEPRYWVAPALAALDDHWEPLQGGGIKQLGIMKPWAPPRSYGLVVRLDESAEPVSSLHSRAGQRRHGITSVAQVDNELYFTSKGNGAVLKLAVSP